MRPKKYFYTVGEAAQFLGVSANTLRNWENTGKLVPSRTKGGSRRYRFEQLKVLLKTKNPSLLESRLNTPIAKKIRRQPVRVERTLEPARSVETETVPTAKAATPLFTKTVGLFAASAAFAVVFATGAISAVNYLKTQEAKIVANLTQNAGGVLGETETVNEKASPTPTKQNEEEKEETGAAEDIVYDVNSFTIQTARDGDITLVPTGGGGQVIVRSSTTTKDSLYIQNANLTTGSLIGGYVGNNSPNYNLLYLSSGARPVERFSVDAFGNVYALGSVEAEDIHIDNVVRLNTFGRLASITGYYQDSGLFEIDQGSPDTATIEKSPTASQGPSTADVFKITLDETNTTSSNTDALVIERKNGGSSGFALDVRNGNTSLAGDLTIGGNTTITGNITSTGGGTLTVSTLTVTGDSDLQGTISDSTGNLTLGDSVDISGALTLASTLSVSGTTTLSSSLDVTGIATITANLNANGGIDVDDAFVIADGGALTTSQTATFNGSLAANAGFTLGDDGDLGSIDTSDWNISTTGVLTGISGVTTDGAYTQSGTGANTFSGATSFTASGTALSVTNNALIGGNLDITGNLDVNGITTVSGNITLGDTASNTITFTGVVNSNVLPSADATYNLGSASRQWNNIYGANGIFSNLVSTTTEIGGTKSAAFGINTDNATLNAEISSVYFDTGSATFNATLQWNASGDAGRVSGFDNTLLTNYPIALYSEVSGANQTFTSGSLFKYGQNATHAITQSSAFIGIDLDFSSNITVPDSASGNQTGSKVTLKDGGASATTIGYQTAGTLDYGLDIGGTVATAEIRLSNGETIKNTVDGTVELNPTTLTLNGTTTVTASSLATLTTAAILTVSGDLAIGGGNITSALTLDQTLAVTGISTLVGNLNANGGLDIDDAFVVADGGVLTTSQTANFDGTADFDGDVLVSDTNIAFDGASTTFTPTGILTILGTQLILGNNTQTAEINSTGWDIDISGNFTGAGTIASDGDITITKESPSLVLNGATTTDTDFWLSNTTDGGGDDDDLFQIGDGTTPGTNPFLTINTSGNVGIGTTAPTQKLEVSGVGLFNTPNVNEVLLGMNANTTGHEGVSLYHDGSEAFITSVDAGTAWHDLTLQADEVRLDLAAGSDTVVMASGTWTFGADTNFVLSGGVNGMSFDTSTLSIDATNDRVGIGTASPSALLHLLQDSATTNAGIELQRIARSTSGTAVAGIGAYTSTYLENGAGSLIEAGRTEFGLSNVTSGDATAAYYRVYTERSTYADMSTVFGAHVTDASRFLCLNGTESNSVSSWDCFGMTIGSANAVTYSFDGTTVAEHALSGTTFGLSNRNGYDMNFVTLGSQPIYFDTSNNGTDLYISSGGDVSIGSASPSTALEVQAGSLYQGTIRVDTDSVGQYSSYGWMENGTLKWSMYNHVGSTPDDSLIIADDGGIDLFTFTQTGNFGIGTTSPSTKISFGTSAANVARIIGTYQSGNAWSGFGMDSATEGIRIAGDRTGANPVADFGYYSSDGNFTWTDLMRVRADGNVGIGTTSPAAGLTVVDGSGARPVQIGDMNCTAATWAGIAFGTLTGSCDDYSLLGNNADTILNAPAGGDILFRIGNTDEAYFDQSGNFALGTTTPATYQTNSTGNLDVVGGGDSGITARFWRGGSEKPMYIGAGSNTWTGITGETKLRFATAAAASFFSTLNGNSGITIDSSNNIGIGTAGPTSLLSVLAGGSIVTPNSDTQLLVQNNSTTGVNSRINIISGNAATSILEFGDAEDVDMGAIHYDNSTNALKFRTNNTNDRMAIDSSGNVGIGTISPASTTKLAVYGTDINMTLGPTTTHTQLYSSFNSQKWTSLEIYDDDSATAGAAGLALTTLGGATTTGSVGTLSFVNKSAGTEGTHDMRIGIIAGELDGAVNSGKLIFYTSSAGTIGIGMTLDKNKNLAIVGNCSDAAGGSGCTADYAEAYVRDINDPMEKGDLLAIHPETGKVTRATITRPFLVGVFSEAPGSLIGQRRSSIQLGVGKGVTDQLDPDEVPVALTGRVPTKVSTENGPISPGDDLTVSSIDGVAAKAIKPGPVVGKALEGYSGSEIGKVWVFVNVSYADPNSALASITLDDSGSVVIPSLIADKAEIEEVRADSIYSRVADFVTATAAEILATTVTTKDLWVEGATFMGEAIVQGSLEVAGTLTAKEVKTEKLVSPLANIDSLTSKEITTETLVAEEATVSGTLYADKIKAGSIETDEVYAKESIVDRIRSRLDSLETSLQENYEESVEEGTETLLAERALEESVDPLEDTSLFVEDPESVEVNAASLNLTGQFSVLGDINAYGTTNLADTIINGKLTVAAIIAPEGLLDVLGGLLVLDATSGTVKIAGNLEVSGVLATSDVKTEKLTILAPAASESATVAAEAKSNAIAGKATLKAGETSLKIYNSKVTDNTLIYVTPSSSTRGQVLFIENKLAGDYFTVSLDEALPNDVEFSWWLVELQNEEGGN